MATLKQNMLEFMKFGFATQNLEIVHRCNDTHAIAVAEWRRCIRDKRFSHAIGSIWCVGSWSNTPQGYGYWDIMTRRIPIGL